MKSNNFNYGRNLEMIMSFHFINRETETQRNEGFILLYKVIYGGFWEHRSAKAEFLPSETSWTYRGGTWK